MSQDTSYRQCWLQRPAESAAASWHRIVWLPEKFARLGLVLRLRDEVGVWTDGWRVRSVGPYRKSQAELCDQPLGARGNNDG